MALISLWLACGPPATSGPTVVATDPDSEGGAWSLTCWTEPHASPILCTLQAPRLVAPTFVWGPADDPGRFSASGTEGAVAHAASLWRTVAGEDHRVAVVVDGVEVVEATVPATEVPPTLEVTAVVDGEALGVDALLLPFACGGSGTLSVMEVDGTVVWWADLPDLMGLVSGSVNAVAKVTRPSFVALVGRSNVVEIGFDGQIQATVGSDVLLAAVHHHVEAVDDEVLALQSRLGVDPSGRSIVSDGVRTFDAGLNPTHEFTLIDALDPSGFVPEPVGYWAFDFVGAIDVFHTNSVTLAPDDSWLLSLYSQNTLVWIGAPAAADAGALRWAVAGQPGMPLSDHLALVSTMGIEPVSFLHPHHATMGEDGRVLLLDSGDSEPTRVLEMVPDFEAGIVDVVAAWDLGVSCPHQGGVVRLPDGALLATCSGERTVFRLEQDQPTPVGSLELRCEEGFIESGLPRAVPHTWSADGEVEALTGS